MSICTYTRGKRDPFQQFLSISYPKMSPRFDKRDNNKKNVNSFRRKRRDVSQIDEYRTSFVHSSRGWKVPLEFLPSKNRENLVGGGSFPSIEITPVALRERYREGKGRGRIGRQWIIRENMRSKRRRRRTRSSSRSPREKERIPFGGFFARNFDPSGIPSGFHPWKGLKIFAWETRATPPLLDPTIMRLSDMRQPATMDWRRIVTGQI